MVSAPPAPAASLGRVPEKAGRPPGAGELPLEGALRLLGGSGNEERVLGVTLALHHSELLAADPASRARLLAALDPAFVCQLLCSAPALRRVAIAALRILLVDPPAAAKLWQCAGALSQACVTASAAEAEAEEAERAERLGEIVQASEALRQLLRLQEGPGGAARSEAAAAAAALLEALSPGGALATWRGEPGVPEAALALAQEVAASAHAGGGAKGALAPARRLVEGTCLDRRLRGSPAHVLALGLLAELVEAGAAPSCLDEALGEAVAAGVAARPAALVLAAAALSTCGLSFGQRGGPRLARLRPLLELAAGELRLGLEGHAPRENLYAACAALEAAAVALGREAEALEASAHLLEEASDCLRQIHKAIAHVHDYCADLSPEGDPPVELALVARLAAAWQLEDPRQFSVEFQRSLPAFCALPPADFAVLLPCIQETHDWHLTPALGAVLRTALAAAGAEASLPDAAEVWRQAAGMLTEVALDAAAYLPEAPLCAPPQRLLQRCRDGAAAAAAAAAAPPVRPVVPSRMPRPVPAAEPAGHGVQMLCDWSCVLWAAGAAAFAPEGHRRWELGVVCGALLVSVPEAAVVVRPEVVDASAGAWAATASCLFAGSQAEASTWRLAMRLAGFALDRHAGLAAALAMASAAQPRPWAAPVPPPGAAPGRGVDDEWAVADTSAAVAVSDFLVAVSRLPAWTAPRVASPAAALGAAAAAATPPGAGCCLEDMD
ncbi:unnamed protein product [Prorocentrum cordatum]|uniref:Neurochondrin n=1 Tax=Prorocentrum cordatum TaxID=2364126 RepID=A0ABN9WBI8_9DINO|nr:unnamed protein product [Polarella glacialis]